MGKAPKVVIPAFVKARIPPPTKENNVWWIQNYDIAAKDRAMPPEEIEVLYKAICEGQLYRVRHLTKRYPYCIHTKIFGGHKRSALYIASFMGQLDIVKFLIKQGADKSILCDGFRPIDVAGWGTHNPVQRMRILECFGEYKSPAVVLTSKDVKNGRIIKKPVIVINIFFSEPVWEFTECGIEVHGGELEKFSSLMADRYSATIRLSVKVGECCTIQVQERAAVRDKKSPYEVSQDPSHYSTASSKFVVYNCRKPKQL